MLLILIDNCYCIKCFLKSFLCRIPYLYNRNLQHIFKVWQEFAVLVVKLKININLLQTRNIDVVKRRKNESGLSQFETC